MFLLIFIIPNNKKLRHTHHYVEYSGTQALSDQYFPVFCSNTRKKGSEKILNPAMVAVDDFI